MAELRRITAKVVQQQFAPDAIPLTLNPGDKLVLGNWHPGRGGYVWCEDGQISAGWVPADLIDNRGDGNFAKAEYCSAELEVAPGDTVRLLWEDVLHGAWWCEDAHHERGWVRAECLQFEEPVE
jgi:hypothetical protein